MMMQEEVGPDVVLPLAEVDEGLSAPPPPPPPNLSRQSVVTPSSCCEVETGMLVFNLCVNLPMFIAGTIMLVLDAGDSPCRVHALSLRTWVWVKLGVLLVCNLLYEAADKLHRIAQRRRGVQNPTFVFPAQHPYIIAAIHAFEFAWTIVGFVWWGMLHNNDAACTSHSLLTTVLVINIVESVFFALEFGVLALAAVVHVLNYVTQYYRSRNRTPVYFILKTVQAVLCSVCLARQGGDACRGQSLDVSTWIEVKFVVTLTGCLLVEGLEYYLRGRRNEMEQLEGGRVDTPCLPHYARFCHSIEGFEIVWLILGFLLGSQVLHTCATPELPILILVIASLDALHVFGRLFPQLMFMCCMCIYARQQRLQQHDAGRPMLTPQDIEQLAPKQLYVNVDPHALTQSSCSVCLIDFSPDDSVRVLTCHHGFHDACIVPWLIKHNSCPMCRRAVSSGEQQPLRQDPAPVSYQSQVDVQV